ncbi:pyridoxal-phosphate dependent enzyme [Micromonospora sp. DT47]|uniref:pyridoxal-phosphate dependent enzyme n=1 Tax=Micromonospora sp. DT47 TaxID=3393431 RepID=UPI003CF0E796
MTATLTAICADELPLPVGGLTLASGFGNPRDPGELEQELVGLRFYRVGGRGQVGVGIHLSGECWPGTRPESVPEGSSGTVDDLILVPVGGGGLMAGAMLAAQSLSPGCAVVGVEPVLGNDAELSLSQGQLVSIDTPRTIADGAQVRQLGRLPFDIIRSNGGRVVTVSDKDLTDAMALVARHLPIVAEPTACLPIAAVLTGAVPVSGRRVGVLVSGGNVDLEWFTRLLAARRDAPSGQQGSVASSSRISCPVRG